MEEFGDYRRHDRKGKTQCGFQA
ncbi:hypothetical protein Gohar_012594, partial [Gossypium harknessii]|nr:hypothetical protein [Gossypium harknessii]